MFNENIEIFKRKNKLVLSYGNVKEVIFDERDYNNSIENFGSSEDNIFNIIHKKYEIKSVKDIEENFLYLYNFILVNNISNYIIDKCFSNKNFNILFDESIKDTSKEKIKLSGRLDTDDALGDIIICLLNRDEYLDEVIRLDYGKILSKENKIEKLERKSIENYFKYEPENIKTLKEKLEIDLIKYDYVNKDEKNSENRYTLPIYIDEESLSKKIPNYSEYLINWTSIAYLNMIEKIHNNFVKEYNLDCKLGLVNDELTVAIISLIDAEIKDYPKGLDKSLEKGREINGKCFFIDSIIRPIPIAQDVAMILQSRDAFEVVPNIFKAKIS